MTCIAGAVKGTEIWIGADAVSLHRDDAVRMGVHSKVFQVGEFLIGESGTLRINQAIRYLFQPPVINGADLTTYMVKEFAPALRALMKEQGGEITTSTGNVEMDARLMVGVRGRLFEIDSGYAVFESRAKYAAIGCADQEALAAMFTVNSLLAGDATPEDVVRRGLLAAAEFDVNIRPPFTILKLNA